MPAATAASGPVLNNPAKSPSLANRGAGRWADLGLRAASALVLLPVVLYAAYRGGLAWLALLVLACLLGLNEWRAMGRAGHLTAAARLAGALYIGLALVRLVWLRHRPGGLGATALLLGAVWATDIGAYLAGRFVGGRRLAPSISPGKTWSGAVGGLGAALLAGVWLGRLAGLPPGRAAGLAALLSIAAQAGDLLESAAKRRCGVKDSGRLIPGHGGLLDRVDGILAAAPVLAAVIYGLGLENGSWNWHP